MLWTSFFFHFIRRWMLKNKLVVSGDWPFFSSKNAFFIWKVFFGFKLVWFSVRVIYYLFIEPSITTARFAGVLMAYVVRDAVHSKIHHSLWVQLNQRDAVHDHSIAEPVNTVHEWNFIDRSYYGQNSVVAGCRPHHDCSVFYFFFFTLEVSGVQISSAFCYRATAHTHTHTHTPKTYCSTCDFFFAGQHVLTKQIPFLF